MPIQVSGPCRDQSADIDVVGSIVKRASCCHLLPEGGAWSNLRANPDFTERTLGTGSLAKAPIPYRDPVSSGRHGPPDHRHSVSRNTRPKRPSPDRRTPPSGGHARQPSRHVHRRRPARRRRSPGCRRWAGPRSSGRWTCSPNSGCSSGSTCPPATTPTSSASRPPPSRRLFELRPADRGGRRGRRGDGRPDGAPDRLSHRPPPARAVWHMPELPR